MAKKKKPKSGTWGICKLTRHTGQFVNSHIIPEALTRPSISGNPLFQHGDGIRPTRRWTSWYDSQLVTSEGERCLSELDTWAISKLREHRLVWSGWGVDQDLGDRHKHIYKTVGIRRIDGIDTRKLRLFFFSLLWRAAASNRIEFKDISVSPDNLEGLRRAVLRLDDPPLSFFPVQLTQLSTKGVVHNHAPIRDVKYVPNLENPEVPPVEFPTFRFYMDGLIAHINRSLPAEYDVKALGNLVVGAESSIVLSTVSFEDSLQRLELTAALEGTRAAPQFRP